MQDVEGTVAALREHGKKGNPAAIWWNRYRKKHILYGQKGQRAVRKVGPQRRTRKQEEGKGLFQ